MTPESFDLSGSCVTERDTNFQPGMSVTQASIGERIGSRKTSRFVVPNFRISSIIISPRISEQNSDCKCNGGYLSLILAALALPHHPFASVHLLNALLSGREHGLVDGYITRILFFSNCRVVTKKTNAALFRWSVDFNSSSICTHFVLFRAPILYRWERLIHSKIMGKNILFSIIWILLLWFIAYVSIFCIFGIQNIMYTLTIRIRIYYLLKTQPGQLLSSALQFGYSCSLSRLSSTLSSKLHHFWKSLSRGQEIWDKQSWTAKSPSPVRCKRFRSSSAMMVYMWDLSKLFVNRLLFFSSKRCNA